MEKCNCRLKWQGKCFAVRRYFRMIEFPKLGYELLDDEDGTGCDSDSKWVHVHIYETWCDVLVIETSFGSRTALLLPKLASKLKL